MNVDQFQQFMDANAATAAAAAAAALAAQGAHGGGRAKISKFSSGVGLEWRTWRGNFVIFAGVNEWGDLRQRQEAKGSMEGDASRMIQDIPHDQGTIVQMLDAFEARFLPAAAGRMARVEYDVAIQDAKETPLMWHSRLRELYDRAYPDGNNQVDQHLRDKFTLGLYDPAVRRHVCDAAPATYAEVLESALGKTATEAVLATVGTNRGAAGGAFSIGAVGPSTPGGEGGPPAGGFRSTGPCWHCEKLGHIKRECPILRGNRRPTVAREAGGAPGRGGFRGNRGRGTWPRRGRGNGRGGVHAFGPTETGEDEQIEENDPFYADAPEAPTEN